MTRRHYFLIALLPLMLMVAWHFLSPGRQLRAAQKQLLEAISSKDHQKLDGLLAENYTDTWGFTRRDWPLILTDLRRLSPIFEIRALNPQFDTKNGVVETGLQAISAGGPAAEYMESQAAELKQPTRFLWKRESWRPWSWRLYSIENRDVELPSSYRPGSYSGDLTF